MNEFRSGRWEDPDEVLQRLGFTLPGGAPYGDSWIGWSFLYMGFYFLLATFLCAVGLTFARERVESKTLQQDDKPLRRSAASPQRIHVPFIPVALSFHDICYDVSSSKGNQTLRLLHSINGLFQPGRMCALMGTSGAG